MNQRKSSKIEINSPIIKEKKGNNIKTSAREQSDSSLQLSLDKSQLQLSLDKSYRKQESPNPKEKRMRRVLEKNMNEYKTILQKTHIPEIFRIICNEIISKELQESEIYSYTANRLIEIGKMLENEQEQE